MDSNRKDEMDDFDYPDDDNSVWCDRCQGSGTVDCYCGGDQCYCRNYGEKDCPRCGGDGYFVPKPGQLEREAEEYRQMQAVIANAARTPKENPA